MPAASTLPMNALLSADFIEQLERLSLLARRPVRGWAAGQRRSRRAGHSVEFCDYRAYGAGDDLRYVDWNIFGRTDRLYVKLFVDDEDLCLHILVDASGSMDWGEPSKLQWAAQVAGALGFIGLASMERVGLGVLREDGPEGWSPGRGRSRIPPLLQSLSDLRGGGVTRLNDALTGYATRANGAGIAVVFSDLLDPGGYEAGLRALLEKGFEVHLVHVLSPDEMKPELRGDLRLVDQETGEARLLRIDAETLRRYGQRLERFLGDAEAFCRRNEVAYYRATTDMPPEQVVLGPLRGKLLT
jgi:uncharacterized protein (DUF58 family)